MARSRRLRAEAEGFVTKLYDECVRQILVVCMWVCGYVCMYVQRLSTSPHSLLNWSQWNLYQSIDKTKKHLLCYVSAHETNQEAVWEAKTSRKLDKFTYLSHVFTIFSANFLLSKKWIAPVCSWEFSGQERYVIFMKNKENHGENELNIKHLNDKNTTWCAR